MTFNQKIVLSFSISLTVFALGFMFMMLNRPENVYGSVSLGSDYVATTTRESLSGVAMVTKSLTPTGQLTNGVFGAFVITGANTGIVNFYDATTTGPHSDHATTTLASFPASTAANTYTFDAAYHRGLLVEIIGTVSTSTILYR